MLPSAQNHARCNAPQCADGDPLPPSARPSGLRVRAVGMAIASLCSTYPGHVLAAAGYGGGGAGGVGIQGGGGGGQGGGLTGGVGGIGGDGWAAMTSGANGGGDGNNPRAFGGWPGQAGSTSADGTAGGAPGAWVNAMGAGGGGGGVIGAGGGGGGSVSGSSLNDGTGGNRGTFITLPGTHTIGAQLYGDPGWDANVGGGGGGGAAVVVPASGVDLTVDRQAMIAGGAGGGSLSVRIVGLTVIVLGGGGGGGAGVAMRSGTLTVQGQIAGGTGGDSPYRSGDGGDAVVLTSGSVIVGQQARVIGGQGGTNPFEIPSLPGRTGNGGTGLSIGSGSVVNEGRIDGGQPGTPSPGSAVISQGASGAAVRAGTNTAVTNKGIFFSASDAVVFEGNNNTLTLWQGSTTTGDVRFEGAGNTLALGSDPGTPTAGVTMTGSLALGANGIYAVRANAGTADRLSVTGSATLTGATVQVTAAPGAYAANTAYDILHAGGTFNGTRFAGVTADLAYLTPSLTYAANDQDLLLTLTRRQVPPGVDPGTPGQPIPGGDPSTRPIRFADLVSGRNPAAAANAIDGMPSTHEVYRHALNLPNGAPQSFFSALSGETHANAASAVQGLSSQTRSVPLAHLRANLGAGLSPGAPTAAAGMSDAAPAASTLPGSNARPAWAQLVGNWQRLGATADTAAVRLHTGGVFAGADGAAGNGWRLGGALGYTDSNLRTDGVDAKTDISSYSAIVYGGRAFDAGPGKLNLMLGAAYTWHDLSTQRRIAVGGLDQTLRADYGASTTQVFTELGWALPASATLTLEPYGGLAWAGQRSRAFQESGGSAALSGASQTSNTTTTTLGLRGHQALLLGRFQGSLTAGAGWRHAFGELRPTSKLAFDAGDAFTVAGAPIARNAALLEAGLDAAVGRNATIGLSYGGQFGSGNQDHSATLSWRWAF